MTSRLRRLIVPAVLCAFLAVPAAAEEPAALWTFEGLKAALGADAFTSELSRAEVPVSIDRSLLGRLAAEEAAEDGAPGVGLPLLDGQTYLAERRRLEVRGDGDWTWFGALRLPGEVGDVEGSGVLTVVDGALTAFFQTETATFQILPVPGGHRLVEVDGSATEGETCGALPATEASRRLPGAPTPPLLPYDTPVLEAPALPKSEPAGVVNKVTAVIDALVLYTPASRSSAGGTAGIRSVVQNNVDLMNESLERSLIDARVRLAHTEEIAYTESTTSMQNDLSWVTTSPEAAQLREQHAADFVALIVNQSVGGTLGIAWTQNRSFNGDNFSGFGFSVTARSAAGGDLVFAHELGHNLGCQHDPANGAPASNAFQPYSFAHFRDGVYRTVMGTGGTCGSCQRIRSYSNPDVEFRNNATGIPNERDNARSLRISTPIATRFGDLRGTVSLDRGGVAVAEGAGSVTFEIGRVNGFIGEVSVRVETQDGTAVAGEDYGAVGATVSFPYGLALGIAEIEIDIVDDQRREDDETFRVVLSSPGGGAGLGPVAAATVTILNDDEQLEPSTLVVPASVTVPEGGTGEVAVTRDGPTDGAVSVAYELLSSSATVGEDLATSSGVLSWADGEGGTRTVPLTAPQDALVEGEERAIFSLSNVTGNAVAPSSAVAVAVADDDTPPAGGQGVISLVPGGTGSEADGQVLVTLRRTGGTSGTVEVDYALEGDTATAGTDFDATGGTVTFAAGESTATIAIPVVDDGAFEGNETIVVTLTSVAGGAALGGLTSVRASIVDDDGPLGPMALTGAQVQCDQDRLEGFLARTRVEPVSPSVAGAGVAADVALSYSLTGDFAGVAVLPDSAFGPQRLLTFSINPEEMTLLRNPERPQLASVSLTRNRPNTDLVTLGSDGEIQVVANPTLDLVEPNPAGLLTVGNVELPAGDPTDAKPGRGLSDLVAACHGPFSGHDVHLFRVLSRMVRGAGDPDAAEVAIFRGEAPNTYRLHLVGTTPDGDVRRGAFELEVTDRTPAGALVSGWLRALPVCDPLDDGSCSNAGGTSVLEIAQPTFDGAPAGPAAVPSVKLLAATPNSPVIGPGVPVDFTALLAGTSWRVPFDPDAGGGTVDPGAALTPAELVCSRDRTAGLLGRTDATAPEGAIAPPGLNLYLTQSGDFAGLAYTGDGDELPENHLAFSTNPEETTLLLNPARPQLSAISLSRNALNSDLVDAVEPGLLTLTINPTLDLVSPDPAGLLVIDNQTGDGADAASTRPGRGLADLVERCHGKSSTLDAHVLQVLAKLVRLDAPDAAGTEIALYRGADPMTYRIDAYTLNADRSVAARLTAEVTVTTAGGGALSGGTLELVDSTTQSGVSLLLVPPVFDGLWDPADAVVLPATAAAPVAFSWADLLAGTTWRSPL